MECLGELVTASLYEFLVGLRLRCCRVDEYAEFVAADSAEEGLGGEGLTEYLSDVCEDAVAVCVTESVVYALEVVEVKQDKSVILGSERVLDSLLGEFLEGLFVEDTCELVDVRL